MSPLIQYLTTFSILAAVSLNVNGQSKNGDLENLSLQDLLNVKITTVSKTTQSAGEAPATVIVISAKQIRTRGYRNLSEVLNDLPDVKVNEKSDPQSFNSFSIRGINRQDRFVVLIDGIKISSPTNDPVPVLENYPIYLAKQIEVVFGPGSALYGADAMSGVINIITGKGAGDDKVQATVMGGAYGYSNQHLFIRKTLKNGSSLSVGGQYMYDRQPDFSKIYPEEFSMKGQQTGVFNSSYGPMKPKQPIDPDYSAPLKAYNLYVAMNKGGFDFKLLHHYAQVPSSTTLKPENGVYNKDVFYGHGISTANVSYTDTIGKLISTTGFQGSFYKVNPHSNYRNLYGGMEHGYKYSDGSMMKLDEQLSMAVCKKINLMAGITYEMFKAVPKSVELARPQAAGQALEGSLLNSAAYYNPQGIPAKFYSLAYNNIGSFIQGQFEANKILAVTLGVRYDNNSRYGSTVNPRAGLVYRVASATTIKALYGTAYWAPSPHTTYEQYGSFYTTDSGRTYQADYLHLPNPGLKPITSRTMELSVSQQLNAKVNVTLTGYYTRLNNLISGVPDNGNTNLYQNRYLGYSVAYIEVPVNAGVQKSYGGNMYVTSAFTVGMSRFNAWTSVSYINGTVQEFANSSHLTKVQASFIAPWLFHAGIDGYTGDFNYSVRLIRTGKQRGTGFSEATNPYERQTLAGYTLLNATVGYTWKNQFTFFGKVQNALDKRYRIPISVDMDDNNSPNFHGSLQDPLRAMVGLSFSLNN